MNDVWIAAVISGFIAVVVGLGRAAIWYVEDDPKPKTPRVQLAPEAVFEGKRDKALDRLAWSFAHDELSQLDFEAAVDATLAAKDSRDLAWQEGRERIEARRGSTIGPMQLTPPPRPLDAAYSARPLQVTTRAQAEAMAKYVRAVEAAVLTPNEVREIVMEPYGEA